MTPPPARVSTPPPGPRPVAAAHNSTRGPERPSTVSSVQERDAGFAAPGQRSFALAPPRSSRPESCPPPSHRTGTTPAGAPLTDTPTPAPADGCRLRPLPPPLTSDQLSYANPGSKRLWMLGASAPRGDKSAERKSRAFVLARSAHGQGPPAPPPDSESCDLPRVGTFARPRIPLQHLHRACFCR